MCISGLWHTWFDRGLGLAGKIVTRKEGGNLEEKLIRIPRPLLIIPNLAIHLQSTEERGALKINPENHLRPVLCSEVKRLLLTDPEQKENEARPQLVKVVLAKEAGCNPEDIVDLDVCLMDATDSRCAGIYDEFVESARIDNQASTWAGMSAISEITDDMISNSSDIMAAISWDHEEVGSLSYTGANSATLERWMHQVLLGLFSKDDNEVFSRIVSKSFLLSTDGAHGVHPNYADKHQALHKPLLHKGVVVKENCNLRYSSHAATMAFTRAIAERATPPCPIQNIVVRNDSPCGSTIGPMTTARIGVRGVDVGIAQWAMHSIRETCGVDDLFHLKNLITAFFTQFRAVDDSTSFL